MNKMMRVAVLAAAAALTLSACASAPEDAPAASADTGASDELVRVNEALRELETVDAELAELVEMRYFGGYSEVEIAELQGINERTVRRRWDKARAWLFVALGHG